MTLIITRGLPGSGKTTWARAEVAKDPTRRSRISRDDIRALMGGQGVLEHRDEQVITAMHHQIVRDLLKTGRLVIVDDTNLRARHARAWADLARDAGVAFCVEDFIDVPVDECVARDAARAATGGRHVGEVPIREMHGKFLASGRLPDVTPTALGTPNATRQYVPNPELAPAWIVDVDGTLALMSGRGPFDWHRVGEDEPNAPVVALVDALAQYEGDADWDMTILVVSGRDGSCRDETAAWLDRHGIRWDELHMRPVGDQRKDSIVKAEIFWNELAPKYRILGVIDDRKQVVDMWRSMGLMCAQVAPGDF